MDLASCKKESMKLLQIPKYTSPAKTFGFIPSFVGWESGFRVQRAVYSTKRTILVQPNGRAFWWVSHRQNQVISLRVTRYP